MPTLPIILPAGMIAVYGIGQKGATPAGATLPNNFVFASVYNVWAGGETYVYRGDVVSWEDNATYVRLATAGGTYTILPAKLATVDNYIAPP